MKPITARQLWRILSEIDPDATVSVGGKELTTVFMSNDAVDLYHEDKEEE